MKDLASLLQHTRRNECQPLHHWKMKATSLRNVPGKNIPLLSGKNRLRDGKRYQNN